MAVKLRLQRFGTHKRPFYRVVASESTKPRDGKFLDLLGTYDPILGLV
ncbi:MAG: 30S ribosomal protein S16, partial [Tenericutes bacterium GWF2_38_8]